MPKFKHYVVPEVPDLDFTSKFNWILCRLLHINLCIICRTRFVFHSTFLLIKRMKEKKITFSYPGDDGEQSVLHVFSIAFGEPWKKKPTETESWWETLGANITWSMVFYYHKCWRFVRFCEHRHFVKSWKREKDASFMLNRINYLKSTHWLDLLRLYYFNDFLFYMKIGKC